MFYSEEAYYEAMNDRPATVSEAVSEYAWTAGGEPHLIERQWLLTDYDTWIRNPHYTGPDQGHPDDAEQAFYDEINEQEALDALPEPTWISDPDFVEIYPGCFF
jgi:hypothetical protein